jgi:hypothetical protein
MSVTQKELDETIRKTVALYNRLKSPQAIVKVIRVSPAVVTLAFSGSFCYNCAIPLDYVNDFIKDLRIINKRIDLKVGATRQLGTNSFEVDYLVTIL